jgi:choice-of-anchor C domain-containing protein
MSDFRSRRLVISLAVALAAFAPVVAGANLLVNGSFETGPAPGALVPLASGSTGVTGWVVTRAGVDYAGTAWTAAQGFRSVALNGPDAGGIAQTFETLPHASYTVRFYLAGDPETLPDIKTMRVSAAGQTADFTADITGMWAWDPGWNPNVWSFQAVSTSTTIEFYSDMSGPTGATLDSVTVALTSTADVGAPETGVAALAPIAPNPVRAAARLQFTLALAGPARLAVYDLAGREVAVLADGELASGSHEVSWDGRGPSGAAPAGLYFAELRTRAGRLVRQFVVVR